MVWVIFLGGAGRLEGTLASGCLLSVFAPRWSSEGIKAFAWIWLIASTVFFVAGLFEPSFRDLL